jgi:hypothetical protein
MHARTHNIFLHNNWVFEAHSEVQNLSCSRSSELVTSVLYLLVTCTSIVKDGHSCLKEIYSCDAKLYSCDSVAENAGGDKMVIPSSDYSFYYATCFCMTHSYNIVNGGGNVYSIGTCIKF